MKKRNVAKKRQDVRGKAQNTSVRRTRVIVFSVYGKKMAKLIPFILGILAGYVVATIFTVIGIATNNVANRNVVILHFKQRCSWHKFWQTCCYTKENSTCNTSAKVKCSCNSVSEFCCKNTNNNNANATFTTFIISLINRFKNIFFHVSKDKVFWIHIQNYTKQKHK